MSIVATKYDDESVTTAEAQTSSLMLAYPNLKGIFAIDTPSGEGVGAALQSAKAEGMVFGVAYDAAPQEVALLQDGYLNALVIQQPALEGSTAVQYAYDLVTGHKREVQSNVVVPDVMVTTADAGSPSTSEYFYVNSLSGS